MRGTKPVARSAEVIALELKRRLGLINGTGDFETSVGRTVYLGRRTVDKSLVPCVSIIEGDDIPKRTAVGTSYQVTQGYVVMAHLQCDPDDPSVAGHAAVRDLLRAVFTDDEGKPTTQLGGLAADVAYIGKQMSPRPDGQDIIVAIIEIAASHYLDLARPAG